MKQGFTSHMIRQELGFTQVQFAEYFGIPLATVQNWDSRGCMPEYMYKTLLKYIHVVQENDILTQKLDYTQHRLNKTEQLLAGV